MKRLALGLLMTAPLGNSFAETPQNGLPEGFVYVDTVIHDLVIDLQYSTEDNFVGERIDGYLQAQCILTHSAAEALGRVQKDLKPFGLGLKIFDAYRPQRAVDHFVRWSEKPDDTRTKAVFYPDIDKSRLIADGYIASRSSHSRGSTVDVTIVSILPHEAGEALDMGTHFDYFGPESWPQHNGINPGQRAQRLLLRLLMTRHGFTPYPEEWWHFTLTDEPFPDTYFDFPVW